MLEVTFERRRSPRLIVEKARLIALAPESHSAIARGAASATRGEHEPERQRSRAERGHEHDALSIFLGNWRADGTSFTGGTDEFVPDLEGPWRLVGSAHVGRWHTGELSPDTVVRGGLRHGRYADRERAPMFPIVLGTSCLLLPPPRQFILKEYIDSFEAQGWTAKLGDPAKGVYAQQSRFRTHRRRCELAA